MNGLNRLMMMVVLLTGLLGISVGVNSPLVASPDGGVYLGGDPGLSCVKDTDAMCNPFLNNWLCSYIECKPDPDTGDPTCPSDAAEYIRLNSYLSVRNVTPGEVGQSKVAEWGKKACQVRTPCAAAGWGGSKACGLPDPDGKRFCKLATANVPPTSSYTVNQTRADGGSCQGIPE